LYARELAAIIALPRYYSTSAFILGVARYAAQ
jgi:hypothetical protein